MSVVKYRYSSLEDFLISTPLTVDAQLDDGWGAPFPVKGREIEATILFADISGFSARTINLSPVETLIFSNNFFAWIYAEAVRNGKGIVDKYIGDEIMIVFSKEFGSEDPFMEAVQTARWMGERDALDFSPHIGIASGSVIVGYVGTPLKYNCSVFGAPVALAARCASVKPNLPENKVFSTTIVFPLTDWGDRSFEDVLFNRPDGTTGEQPRSWRLMQPRQVDMKNVGQIQIQEIVKMSIHIPSVTAEERAGWGLDIIRKAGRYWPKA